MKRILLAGTESYIGNSIRKWLSQWPSDYFVDEVDMRNDDWKTKDFHGYDAVIHLAAIVHIKEKKELWPLYERVNGILPGEVAKKAKESGIPHFIFMSTKGVYAPNTDHIGRETVPAPTKLYGKSKLQGEKLLLALNDENFHVSILRPAVVYGEGCKGNFPKLDSLSKKIRFFPKKYNRRSMIYIWNLCEYIKRLVDAPLTENLLFPQNKEYIGTLDIMESLWKTRNQKYFLSHVLQFFVVILLKLPGLDTLKTMFSDTVYDLEISNDYNFEYCVFSFRESIENIVKNSEKE